MPFNWDEFLNLAEQLATAPDDASKRSAISRAYYAVFNPAFSRAEQNCGKPVGTNKHEWCWNRYMGTVDGTNKCQEVGIQGDRLKQMRVKADYKDHVDRLDDEVKAAIKRAKDIKGRLQALNAQMPNLAPQTGAAKK